MDGKQSMSLFLLAQGKTHQQHTSKTEVLRKGSSPLVEYCNCYRTLTITSFPRPEHGSRENPQYRVVVPSRVKGREKATRWHTGKSVLTSF